MNRGNSTGGHWRQEPWPSCRVEVSSDPLWQPAWRRPARRTPRRSPRRVLVGQGEVQDHRPQFGPLFGLCRLPVGHLTLRTTGTVQAVNWRLSLWNAELTGTVTTSKGSIGISLFVHDQSPVLVAALSP